MLHAVAKAHTDHTHAGWTWIVCMGTSWSAGQPKRTWHWMGVRKSLLKLAQTTHLQAEQGLSAWDLVTNRATKAHAALDEREKVTAQVHTNHTPAG